MLYQSTGSSSCAVCAVGNLLSFYGVERERQQVIDLFHNPSNRKLPYVTHPRLLDVVASLCPRKPLQWRKFASFSVERLTPVLARETEQGRPVLLTFRMRHSRKDWVGTHCVLVMHADGAGIHVIDSLGRRGRAGPNSTILPCKSPHGWRVAGAPLIVSPAPTRILLGLPRFAEKPARFP
jgi:hypothetical protein